MGKSLLAKQKNVPETEEAFLRVEVRTHRCSEDEAWHHDVPLTPSLGWYSIFDAVNTLYEHEGIESIYIYVVKEN